jgi:hypothetical protein
MESLSEAQQRVVDFVVEVFQESATWPTFQYADKVLARKGIGLQKVLQSMPKGLIYPDVSWRGWHYRPDEELRLTIAGLARSGKAHREVRYFIDALAYIAEREWDDLPDSPSNVSHLQVFGREIKEKIGGTDEDLDRLWLLFMIEPGIYSSLSGKGSEGSISPSADIRRFRGLRDVDLYMSEQRSVGALLSIETENEMYESAPGNRGLRLQEKLGGFLAMALRHPVVSSTVSAILAAIILALLNLR